MLFIDDLLLLPFTGFRAIMNTLLKVAQEEYADDSNLKEELLNMQMRLDLGEISEEEYVQEEARILKMLREVQLRKRELAGAAAQDEDAPQGLSGKVMAGSGASLTVEFNEEHDKGR